MQLFYIWLLYSISVPENYLKNLKRNVYFILYLCSIVFICAVACSLIIILFVWWLAHTEPNSDPKTVIQTELWVVWNITPLVFGHYKLPVCRKELCKERHLNCPFDALKNNRVSTVNADQIFILRKKKKKNFGTSVTLV